MKEWLLLVFSFAESLDLKIRTQKGALIVTIKANLQHERREKIDPPAHGSGRVCSRKIGNLFVLR